MWDGAATVIDWNNGTRGDVAADVARPLLARQLMEYRERTHQCEPEILDRSLAWRLPLAAMMLGEAPLSRAVSCLEVMLRGA